MGLYNVKVVVEYEYEVEADSLEEAEKQGFDYEEWSYLGEIYSIDAEELPEPDEEEDND